MGKFNFPKKATKKDYWLSKETNIIVSDILSNFYFYEAVASKPLPKSTADDITIRTQQYDRDALCKTNEVYREVEAEVMRRIRQYERILEAKKVMNAINNALMQLYSMLESTGKLRVYEDIVSVIKDRKPYSKCKSSYKTIKKYMSITKYFIAQELNLLQAEDIKEAKISGGGGRLVRLLESLFYRRFGLQT